MKSGEDAGKDRKKKNKKKVKNKKMELDNSCLTKGNKNRRNGILSLMTLKSAKNQLAVVDVNLMASVCQNHLPWLFCVQGPEKNLVSYSKVPNGGQTTSLECCFSHLNR